MKSFNSSNSRIVVHHHGEKPLSWSLKFLHGDVFYNSSVSVTHYRNNLGLIFSLEEASYNNLKKKYKKEKHMLYLKKNNKFHIEKKYSILLNLCSTNKYSI